MQAWPKISSPASDYCMNKLCHCIIFRNSATCSLPCIKPNLPSNPDCAIFSFSRGSSFLVSSRLVTLVARPGVESFHSGNIRNAVEPSYSKEAEVENWSPRLCCAIVTQSYDLLPYFCHYYQALVRDFYFPSCCSCVFLCWVHLVEYRVVLGRERDTKIPIRT